MMQPAFLPWQGYFGLIQQAEIFVLLDDFQFSVQSYHQRNRLFTGAGQPGWYTVPVVKSVSFGQPLNRTLIDESGPWRRKMLRRMEQNYSRASYFGTVFPAVEAWLLTRWSSLAEQNASFIELVVDLLGWKRTIRLSSTLPSTAARSNRVLELLHWCGASRYYAAQGSAQYMVEDGVFPSADVEVLFQEYTPVPYRQVGSPGIFVPRLSVLDALYNVGPEGTARIIADGNESWLGWEEMTRRLPQRPTEQSGV